MRHPSRRWRRLRVFGRLSLYLVTNTLAFTSAFISKTCTQCLELLRIDIHANKAFQHFDLPGPDTLVLDLLSILVIEGFEPEIASADAGMKITMA
ncbi:hypothetical protein GGP41_006272 [Bipolaris sorokiniana]|uniref:Uncharacterized protein n=1 Tax=Cochliobolus sativus TaxID=45130 RepID=A0A8H6DVD9_COCSA|nr:hypothetical protein GGP41_006272 [Bipolaris sorokiniana]